MTMRIHLVTGGARSGKSWYAEGLAGERGRAAGGERVTYIATAEAGDDEMSARIDRHRRRRPATWETVEAPRDTAAALAGASTHIVLLDCLTLLAANYFHDEALDFEAIRSAVLAEVQSLIAAAAGRDGDLIVVTNEVGSGIVPANSHARWFRDVLGEANCMFSACADRVTLVVAGCPIVLKDCVQPAVRGE